MGDAHSISRRDVVKPAPVGECPNCGKRFNVRFEKQIYCSPKCRQLFLNRKYKPKRPAHPLRPCPVCGKQIQPKHPKHRYCSNRCRESLRFVGGFDLPGGTVGAVGELLVAADLCLRGYYVFRSVTPNSPCDLIAIAPDGRLLRIEVTKVGAYASGGGFAYSQHNPCDRDVLALWLPDRQIVYEPELPFKLASQQP